MNSESDQSKKSKLLDNPLSSSIVVPIAIVLVAIVVIFGVTQMLSSDRSHRDLVREMHTKTFGNRWAAAYELSKLLATSSIPEDEVPWLITNLEEIFNSAQDPRTREFIVVALGSLKHPRAVEFIQSVLNGEDESLKFRALSAIGNYGDDVDIDWDGVSALLDSSDVGLRHTAVLTLAQHQKSEFQEKLVVIMKNDESRSVQMAAATGLIYFKHEAAVPTLKEILMLDSEPTQGSLFNRDQVYGLKINVLNALKKMNWTILNNDLEKVSLNDKNVKTKTVAAEVLNSLKN